MNNKAYIGIDWGTTNARALLFASEGTLLAEREEPLGVARVASGGFPAAFARLTAEWRTPSENLPVILSGMVGSRQGWREAPYLTCPADLTELPHALVTLPEADGVAIVPGLSRLGGEKGAGDVMRGEELQLLGLGARMARFTTVCIPGTHTKWVRAEWPIVREFHTTMTGELFAAILGHTLFAKIIPDADGATGAFGGKAFLDGLKRSEDAHGLTAALFGIRADLLLGKISPPAVRDLISGLLIGTEIRYWLTRAGARPRIALLAAASIEERYLRAFGFFAVEAEAFDVKGATAAGFTALRRAR